MRAREFEGWLALEFGFSRSEVDQRLRILREAGIISHGGRGPYAPTMRSVEIASILISLCGAERASDTISRIDAYATMPPRGDGPFKPFANIIGALTAILDRRAPCGVISVNLAFRGPAEAEILYEKHPKLGVERQYFGGHRRRGSLIGPAVALSDVFLREVTVTALEYEVEKFE